MESITELAQYLLAVQKPGETKLVRYGVATWYIQSFPPATTLIFNIFPTGFCDVLLQHTYSPAMIPFAFNVEVLHEGSQVNIGPMDSLVKMPFQLWTEIKESSPSKITISNVSGISQYFAGMDEYLLIASEEDYDKVMNLVRKWGAMNLIKPGAQ